MLWLFVVFAFVIGCYSSEWFKFKRFLKIVGVNSRFFPDAYKKTPNWMRKRHEIMQRWIPRYMYYYGHCIIIEPVIVSIFSLLFALTEKPTMYYIMAVAVYGLLLFIQGVFIIIMTRIYAGSWRNFFGIKPPKK